MNKYISILLLFLLLTSCGSDLDITKFTDKEISEKFSYTENGLLYYKKDLYTGQIVKYNYDGGTLDFELNYIDGKYDGLQKSYSEGEIYKEIFFNEKTLESYSLYFPDGSKKEYLDSKGNVIILNDKNDTINYLKINEDKTISYPIIHGDKYNKKYTINESVTKDSLIVYNDDETIIFKNLKNIHQVYPIKFKKIGDITTPWKNNFSFLVSDSSYINYESKQRVFLSLISDDPSINIFKQDVFQPYTTNTEIVSKMSDEFYGEWEDYTFKSISGDSVKGRQMKFSIKYDEERLSDLLVIKDLKLHKLNQSDLFIYSDTIKSEDYKQYIVYPQEITIRNGDSIQKYSYQFITGNIYNDYKGVFIYLDNISISSEIRFNLDDLNSFSNYENVELLRTSFRFDNVINNKVYRNNYFHYISEIDKNKDIGVLTSILKKKFDNGEDNPDLDYNERFMFSTYLSGGSGTKINNINDFTLTSISSITTSEDQFSGYDRYGDARKNYLRVSKSFIPEIDKVVQYVNGLEVKIPNTGLEFIKNNL
jgi:hypothetical protein